MRKSSPSQLRFSNLGRLRVEGNFEGGDLSSEGGLALLREADRGLRLIERAAATFTDCRDQRYVAHSVADMLCQLVYAIAAGYPDLYDHDRLRGDLLLALAAGRADGSPLASPATLCRLQNSTPAGAAADRYRRIAAGFEGLDELLVDIYLESHDQPPGLIYLDVDATDIKLHGRQERRFFHGFYDSYCYLPQYTFAGEHLLGCRLRPADRGAGSDAVGELAPIVARIRKAWPKTRIVIRGDSGYCGDPIMSFCEEQGLGFILGMARNPRLERALKRPLERSRRRCLTSGRPSRRYRSFRYRTLDSWSRPRRVVGKAQYLPRTPGRDGEPRPPKPNCRFVVTNLDPAGFPGRELYERVYCPRGNCERYIGEQLDLFADRASASAFRANQLRLYLSGLAYLLVSALRRLGIDDPQAMQALAEAGEEPAPRPDPQTIRQRYLKVAVRIRRSTRRWLLEFPSSYPYRDEFAAILGRLRQAPVRARAPAG